jgi:AFG3 family protein
VNALIAATGAYAFYRLTLALTGADDSRELTYQDFKTRFLERGLVDRLEVDPTSKQVSVFLKAGAAAALAHGANGGVANLYVDDDQQRNGTSAVSSTPSSGIPSSVSSGGEPPYYFFIGSVESFERSLAEAQRDLNIPPHEWVSVRYMSSNSGGGWLPILLQVGFYGAIFWMIKKTAGGMGVGGMGGGGKGGKNPFSFGKSTAQLIKPGDSKVTFADVAGLDEAKVEVMEFVKFLQAPEKFTRLGAKIPKGALLQGPPGTGQ